MPEATRRSFLAWLATVTAGFSLYPSSIFAESDELSRGLPVFGGTEVISGPDASLLAWPAIGRQQRPWAFWWWMGSAVDPENVQRELELCQRAGMGGLHIIPIYGAKGYEDRYIQYLSPDWMRMLDVTVTRADALGLGIDMTTGTGWCFGGPFVGADIANARLDLDKLTLDPGDKPEIQAGHPHEGPVQAVTAIGADGRYVDLTSAPREGDRIDWAAPGPDKWTIYIARQLPTNRKVKRPAPGGEGWMLNLLDPEAVREMTRWFDRAFDDYRGALPQRMFQDSYEYESDWSSNLLDAFAQRRGYRLQPYLGVFKNEGASKDTIARIKADYRRTVGELIEQSLKLWAQWSNGKGMGTRNQAHGSPGNLLDLYALAEVPETEAFGTTESLMVSKMASSAAHVVGRDLTSSETGTWLDEHFRVSLSDLKRRVDRFFLAGVNHIVYHGMCYSPEDAGWPGWVFYASTEMNPRNSIWRDVPALNDYIARAQSVLQFGQPDNDALVYWPIEDLWHDDQGMIKQLVIRPDDWLTGQPVGKTADRLWDHGVGFDFVSDQQLQSAEVDQGHLKLPGARYRLVVVPKCGHIPLPTLEKLIELAKAGSTVVFESLPTDVPGYHELKQRRARLKAALGPLSPGDDDKPRNQPLGRGRVIVGALDAALRDADVSRETMVDHGLRFIRRSHADGKHYFIRNDADESADESFDGWVTLASKAASVVVLDPMTGASGLAETEPGEPTRVRLQLTPGQSVILRTFDRRTPKAPRWAYVERVGKPVELSGPWNVRFIEGGPTLPKPYETRKLKSWTKQGDEAERFAGAAEYHVEFDGPALPAGATGWQLDLGAVRDSARVTLNGLDLGTRFTEPMRLTLPELKPTGNVLKVQVTNRSSNRIRDLDRRGVKWHQFHDIGFVNIHYHPFDASKWSVMDAGLLGPVTLQPIGSTGSV